MKTEGAIKNGQSGETSNIGHTRHRTKTNKTKNITQKIYMVKENNQMLINYTDIKKWARAHLKCISLSNIYTSYNQLLLFLFSISFVIQFWSNFRQVPGILLDIILVPMDSLTNFIRDSWIQVHFEILESENVFMVSARKQSVMNYAYYLRIDKILNGHIL